MHEIVINGKRVTIYGIKNGCQTAMKCLTEELRDNKIHKYKNIVLFDWHPLVAFELSLSSSNKHNQIYNFDLNNSDFKKMTNPYSNSHGMHNLDIIKYFMKSETDILSKSMIKESMAWYFSNVLSQDTNQTQHNSDGYYFFKRDTWNKHLFHDAQMTAAWHACQTQHTNLYSGRLHPTQEVVQYSEHMDDHLVREIQNVAIKIYGELMYNQEFQNIH